MGGVREERNAEDGLNEGSGGLGKCVRFVFPSSRLWKKCGAGVWVLADARDTAVLRMRMARF